MYIRSFLQDKQMTITLSGEIDHHEARHAMKTIAEKIDAYLPRVCVLDFLDVSFMDSSGIAIVISAVRRMREIGGKLVLTNVQAQPMKVLKAAGIEQIAEIKGGGTK
jgi:stage II sporulation protein AA (anti-sigma F factor antagonist)